MVVPITQPRDAVMLQGSTNVWLPEGTWVDIFTGTVYGGNRLLAMSRDLSGIPVLMKAGEILPLAMDVSNDVESNPERMEVLVAVGADADFTLIEDDGSGASIADVRTARTRLTWNHETRTFTVHAVEGHAECIPLQREWKVTFLSLRGKRERYSVSGTVSRDKASSFQLDVDASMATPDKKQALYELLNRAQFSNTGKEHIWRLISSPSSEMEKVQALRAIDAPASLVDSIIEILGSVGDL
jgi:hypothetical protein